MTDACTCNFLNLCAEAERLAAVAYLHTLPDTPEHHAAHLAYLRHRAPFAPSLRPLLAQAEAR